MKCPAALWGLASTLTVLTLAHGQTKNEPNKSNLELRLEPDGVKDGVAQAFQFKIINTTDHDVTFPMPSVQCSNPLDGEVNLSLRFRPLHPDSTGGLRGGCAGDLFGPWPGILDRIKTWKVLHSGESLSLKADRAHLFYDDQPPGEYEFWASYKPPYVKDLDQQLLLQQAGIDFPQGILTSPRLTFRKRP